MSTKTIVDVLLTIVLMVVAAASYGAMLLGAALLVYWGYVDKKFADSVSATPEHAAYFFAGFFTPLIIWKLHRWFNS